MMSGRVPLGSGDNSNRMFIDLTEDSDKEISVSVYSLSRPFFPFLPHWFYILFLCLYAKSFLHSPQFTLYLSYLYTFFAFVSVDGYLICVLLHIIPCIYSPHEHLLIPLLVAEVIGSSSSSICDYIDTPVAFEDSSIKEKEFGSI